MADEAAADRNELDRLVRSTAHHLRASDPLDRHLIERWATCLMRQRIRPTPQDYSAGGALWHGITMGRWLKRRDFGIGYYHGQLTIRVKIVRGWLAGTWYFSHSESGCLAVAHNGRPHSGTSGISDYDLIAVTFMSVIAGV